MSDAIPWLTSEYLQKILQNFFKDDSLHVHDFTITTGSNPGDSYAGQVHRISLKYTRNNQPETRSIIAKTIPNTELTKEWNAGGYSMYETEIKMMSTLPLLYNELCAKGFTEKFFPYLYELDIDKNVILMEDLKPKGYTLVDRKSYLDLDHTLIAIKALARFHASSILLLKKDPSLKEKYSDYLFKKNKGSIIEKYTDGSYNYLLMFLDKWDISEEDKNIFRSFKEKLYYLSCDVYSPKDSSFNVLIHGDFTIRNMMFSYRNKKVKSVKVFDYQDCHYNSIGLDINYFLFTSIQNNVIVNYLEDIFRAYYEEFVRVTGEIEGFTLDTVRKEFVERLMNGFNNALLLRSVMYSDKPCDIMAYSEGRDSEVNIQMYKNPVYIADITKLLPVFKKYGLFK